MISLYYRIDSGHSISCLLVNSFSCFFLNVFLFFEMVAVGHHEILLRLSYALELPLNNRIRDIIHTSCTTHAVNVKGVYHLPLCIR
jgi:hypothetical protein